MNMRPIGDRFRPDRLLAEDEDKRILRHSLGSGATPLTITGHPEVAQRQARVQQKLRKRIARNLGDRSPLIRQFAEQNFLGRFARRLDRNQASYDTRLVEEIPAEIQDAHDRVLIGDGSPKDALVVMGALKMRSIELARLTHPNTDMNDDPQLDAMLEGVYEAVLDLDGELHDTVVPTYELSNLDTIVPPPNVPTNQAPAEHEAVREGVMVTAKQHVATMQDGTKVIQRTSYIIDLNELPLEISQAIRAVETLKTPDAMDAISSAAQLDILMPYLIGRGSAEKSVIPISTTIFAHNELVAQIIKDRENPVKSDTPSESMQKFYEAYEDDAAQLAKIWKYTEEQRQNDRYTRSIGSHVLNSNDLPYSD